MNESKCTHYDPDYTGLCIECGHDLDYTTQGKPKAKPYQPEVGDTCEGLRARVNKYMKCEILAHKNGMYAVSFKDMEELQWCCDFRPIKTERELFIEQAKAIFKGENRSAHTVVAGVLYDNGARFK